jgi:hypothetical protein
MLMRILLTVRIKAGIFPRGRLKASFVYFIRNTVLYTGADETNHAPITQNLGDVTAATT